MKKTFTILSLLVISIQFCFGQHDTFVSISELDEYSIKIDSLVSNNLLSINEYEEMSYCGGHLKGYYQDSNLLYLSSTYSAEVGYRKLNAYFLNGVVVKITRYQHAAEWYKYSQEYPNGEGENGDSYENMTYTDTTYTIYMLNPPQMNVSSMETQVGNLMIPDIYEECLRYVQSMKLELEGSIEESYLLLINKKNK